MAGSAECIDYRSAQRCGGRSLAKPRTVDLHHSVDCWIAQYRRWRVLAKQRKDLAALSDRMLKDIGLSRVDAMQEAKRPFWDDPYNF